MDLIIRRLLIYFSVFILITIILGSCANPVAPTGGPKDVDPPVILRTIPADRSLNFKGQKITLYFNEFVSLKDAAKQMIISPPLANMPEFRTRGRSLEISFKDEWREETTYSIFFGDAIVDITESNPIPGYKFTFSTGNVLDSMMIKGRLVNAFNMTPVAASFVMLYDTIYDSVPYKQIPYYISRSNAQGEFQLTNLRNLPYKIFALTDVNANYIYDMPSEDIAFIDQLIEPWYSKPASGAIMFGSDTTKVDNIVDQPVVDSVQITIQADSLFVQEIPADTLKQISDSILQQEKTEQFVQMFHFRELDSIQSLNKATLVKDNVISLSYRFPVKNPQFESMDGDLNFNPVVVPNRIQDTLTMWLPGYTADSVKMKVLDSDVVIDTIEMSVKTPARINRNMEETKVQKLGIATNIISSKIKPDQSLRITFSEPLVSHMTEKIQLLEDSLTVNSFRMNFSDSLNKQLLINYPWKQGIKYTLIVPDSIFIGIMGLTNDSTAFTFNGITEEETSKITLVMDLLNEGPHIIQLLDTKEKLVHQYFISESTTINFNYIAPGKYKIKAIEDRNGNGYWDTGKYLLKRYPERVFYFEKELELRANWTVEEHWLIQ